MDQDDLYFIDKVIDGEVNAFSFLVERYKQPAYALALRITKDEQDAEEVSQDAFVKAFKALKKFQKASSFSTWLYRIVYNTALSKIKKRKIEMSSLSISEEISGFSEINGAVNNLAQLERKKYLNMAMSKLAEDETTMVSLYYSHDKNMDEIATILGTTHGNVRVKLSRVRKKLYKYLHGILEKETRDIL